MEPMEWTVQLPSGSQKNRVIVVIFAVIAAIVGTLLLRSWLAGLFAVLAVFFSTAEIWFPIRYRLDEKGASEKKGLAETQILWENVKRMEHDERGVSLSPLEKPSRLDAFRGVYLRFHGNEEAVLAKIASLRKGDE